LGNLGAEIPAAVELFVSELRVRADQTLQGSVREKPLVFSTFGQKHPPAWEAWVGFVHG